MGTNDYVGDEVSGPEETERQPVPEITEVEALQALKLTKKIQEMMD